MNRLTLVALSLLAVLALGAAPAIAGPILGAVGVTASSPDPFTASPTALIDQSGLSVGYTSGVTDFDTYVATTTASFTADISALGGTGAPPSSLTFDLGSPSLIDAVAIWNQFGSASLNTFTIETSLFSDFSVSQTFGTFTMSIFGGGNPIAADVFTFAPTTAEFVRINILSNAGFASATRLNEVAFRAADASIPEPGALLLLGTGLAAVVARRFRRP